MCEHTRNGNHKEANKGDLFNGNTTFGIDV